MCARVRRLAYIADKGSTHFHGNSVIFFSAQGDRSKLKENEKFRRFFLLLALISEMAAKVIAARRRPTSRYRGEHRRSEGQYTGEGGGGGGGKSRDLVELLLRPPSARTFSCKILGFSFDLFFWLLFNNFPFRYFSEARNTRPLPKQGHLSRKHLVEKSGAKPAIGIKT